MPSKKKEKKHLPGRYEKGPTNLIDPFRLQFHAHTTNFTSLQARHAQSLAHHEAVSKPSSFLSRDKYPWNAAPSTTWPRIVTAVTFVAETAALSKRAPRSRWQPIQCFVGWRYTSRARISSEFLFWGSRLGQCHSVVFAAKMQVLVPSFTEDTRGLGNWRCR